MSRDVTSKVSPFFIAAQSPSRRRIPAFSLSLTSLPRGSRVDAACLSVRCRVPSSIWVPPISFFTAMPVPFIFAIQLSSLSHPRLVSFRDSVFLRRPCPSVFSYLAAPPAITLSASSVFFSLNRCDFTSTCNFERVLMSTVGIPRYFN